MRGRVPGRRGPARSRPARVAVDPREGRGLVASTPPRRTPARPLPGAHQRDNLLVAIRPARGGAARRGCRSTCGALRRGVARTRWPGRLETDPRRPAPPPRRRPQPRRGARARGSPRAPVRRTCSSSGRWATRTCAASRGRSSRGRRRSCSPGPASPRAADARHARAARRPASPGAPAASRASPAALALARRLARAHGPRRRSWWRAASTSSARCEAILERGSRRR